MSLKDDRVHLSVDSYSDVSHPLSNLYFETDAKEHSIKEIAESLLEDGFSSLLSDFGLMEEIVVHVYHNGRHISISSHGIGLPS